MPVTELVQKMLDQLIEMNAPSISDLDPPQARTNMLNAPIPPGPELPKVDNFEVVGRAGPIGIRAYYPSTESNLPAIVYYHGGGWVIGSIDTHDAYCRTLAQASERVVFSVEYRLAPEHPYPAAWHDSFDAYAALLETAESLQFDSQRVCVAGDSAGGNLATVVALEARDADLPVESQVLIYPITSGARDTQSYHDFAEGYYLTKATMDWFWDHYIKSEKDGVDPHVAPLNAEDLHGLPTALVITAEFYPLRDEGEAYAQRLIEADITVTTRRYRGMIHGFVRQFHYPEAVDCMNLIASFLK